MTIAMSASHSDHEMLPYRYEKGSAQSPGPMEKVMYKLRLGVLDPQGCCVTIAH